jgi:predicted nucleotidyltransferase
LTTQLEQKNKAIQNLQSELNQEKEQTDDLSRRMANTLQETKNLKSQLKTTNESIRLTKKHLRLKNLNNLPTLPQNTDGTSKSLKQLISGFIQVQNQVQVEKLRADTYEVDILAEFNITDVSD